VTPQIVARNLVAELVAIQATSHLVALELPCPLCIGMLMCQAIVVHRLFQKEPVMVIIVKDRQHCDNLRVQLWHLSLRLPTNKYVNLSNGWATKMRILPFA
jgi:hypothetical protein